MLNINDVLSYLDLEPTMSAAEFGCGSADFTIALAKKLPKGTVYALDIQEEKLSALKSKVKLEKLSNTKAILCDLEIQNGSTLQNNSQDIVLIPNVLFQVENKHAIIEEAKRILKNGGQLLIIDWHKQSSFSPKQGMISSDQVKKIAVEIGFSLKKEFAAGEHHYALLFIK